jgi:LytS/YehU family sensor histidine kinase
VNIKIDETRDLMIAPFVLMPFVENAFKHVSRDRQTNSIRLRLILTEQQLHLHLSNTISTEEQGKKELIKPGGIGLKNVRRRLDLLYPQRYTLDIENSEKLFEVSLTLTLSEKASIEIPMLHVLQEN